PGRGAVRASSRTPPRAWVWNVRAAGPVPGADSSSTVPSGPSATPTRAIAGYPSGPANATTADVARRTQRSRASSYELGARAGGEGEVWSFFFAERRFCTGLPSAAPPAPAGPPAPTAPATTRTGEISIHKRGR